MSKWTALEDDNYAHVLPVEDIKPHSKEVMVIFGNKRPIAADDCPCNPKVQIIDKDGNLYTKPLIIHNSFEDMKNDP